VASDDPFLCSRGRFGPASMTSVVVVDATVAGALVEPVRAPNPVPGCKLRAAVETFHDMRVVVEVVRFLWHRAAKGPGHKTERGLENT
jgi:hypothetical protein